jgi:hypothetical protein
MSNVCEKFKVEFEDHYKSANPKNPSRQGDGKPDGYINRCTTPTVKFHLGPSSAGNAVGETTSISLPLQYQK